MDISELFSTFLYFRNRDLGFNGDPLKIFC